LGDFHQFLAIQIHPKTVGKNLFEKFDIVIKMEEQMHIQDLTWSLILQRSRTGDCTSQDITEINELVLTNPECDIPDFIRPPWDEAILVTPLNAIRTLWNERKLIEEQGKSNTYYTVRTIDPSLTTAPCNCLPQTG
jgi:hypothetical protein